MMKAMASLTVSVAPAGPARSLLWDEFRTDTATQKIIRPIVLYLGILRKSRLGMAQQRLCRCITRSRQPVCHERHCALQNGNPLLGCSGGWRCCYWKRSICAHFIVGSARS